MFSSCCICVVWKFVLLGLPAEGATVFNQSGPRGYSRALELQIRSDAALDQPGNRSGYGPASRYQPPPPRGLEPTHTAKAPYAADKDGEDDSVTLSVSATLLGAIAFQISLFYVVNFPDDDIQFYAYRTIGFSISLFSSLLIFYAVNGCIQEYLLNGQSVSVSLAVAHTFTWFCAMQLGGGLLSGALGQEELPSPRKGNGQQEKQLRATWNFRRLNVKGWVGMLTELTGLAAMFTLASLQQQPWFSQSPGRALLVVPLGFVVTLALFQATDRIRYWASTIDDGKLSYSEEMWNEQLEDAENDVIALAAAFVTVQAMQFWIIGVMPDEYGKYPVSVTRQKGARECMWMFGFAAANAVCTLLLSHWYQTVQTPVESQPDTGEARQGDGALSQPSSASRAKGDANHGLARHLLIAVNYATMTFAWNVLVATRVLMAVLLPSLSPEGIVLKIVSALVISAVSVTGIIFFDKIADGHSAGSHEERALVRIIMANGLLIGFSWEVCFSKALQAIDCYAAGCSGSLVQLGLSLVVAMVVVPAYRLYILPEIHDRGQRLAQLGRGVSELFDESYSRSFTDVVRTA